MLPLAFIFSKIYKTEWKVPGNALQSLGIWLNVAQLFYFPFLIFLLLKAPDFFVMGYAIITGAHLFPYAWFYEEKAYAFAAGLVSIGAFLIAISVEDAEMFYIPIFTATILTFLGISIYVSTNKKNKVIVH